MGSSSSSEGASLDSFDSQRMRFEGSPSDSFQTSLDKVLMNRVLSGDEPPMVGHFVSDHLRAAEAFKRAGR